jgi:hypothetical protein
MVRDIDLAVDQLQHAIISSRQDYSFTKESTLVNRTRSVLRAKTRPSPVPTKKLGKPNGHHEGGTARTSLMYQVVADS